MARRPPLLAAVATSTAAVALLLAGCTAGSGPTASEPRLTAAPSSSAAPTSRPSLAGVSTAARQRLDASLSALEARYGARLGVAALDASPSGASSSGASPSDAAPSRDRALLGHRSDERFAFASTDKVFIAAAVLNRISDAGLAEVVRYDRTDLLAYAPVTSQHVDSGMTVRALLDAALRYSDNTAANLLMERAGGPAGVQAFLRTLGDSTTSVDRDEPSLNTAVPGDTPDTTTPQAFARDLRAVTTGTALPDSRRRLLVSLMTANTTGAPYIRSGVPTGWSVADKTGSASYGVRNDIALVTPPAGSPLVIVLFSTRTTQDAASQDALLADATRALVAALPAAR